MGELTRNEVLKEAVGIAKLKQLGPNFTMVTIGDKDLYFSYETLVAFAVDGKTYGTAEKYSVTTSKHLNKIKIDERIPAGEFEEFARTKLGG